jgi:AraC-like DNA-binding protein
MDALDLISKCSLDGGQLLEELFEVIPDTSFFSKNSDGVFIACDSSFVKMMGAKNKNEVLGKKDEDLVPYYLAYEYMRDDEYVLKSGNSIIRKLELAPNDGLMPDWRETTKIPLYSQNNQITGLAGITRLIRSGKLVQRIPEDVNHSIEFITNNFSQNITIETVSKHSGMSVSTLERRFKEYFMTTPQKYLRKVRLNAACQLIRITRKTLSEIAQECGFYDQSSLTKEFKKELQITPSAYAKQFSKTYSNSRI